MTITTPPDIGSRRRPALLAVASVLLTVLTAAPLPAEAQVIPPVPANLDVPQGNAAFLVSHATGSQNYVCQLTTGGFAWAFFGPQATLFRDDDQQLITHFLSANPDENGAPRATWQHSQDSSRVWAAAIANSSDPAYVTSGAIPWLLLRAVGAEEGPTDGASLSVTTYVQRVNTTGGRAPASGCERPGDIGRKALVPYTADYIFYRSQS